MFHLSPPKINIIDTIRNKLELHRLEQKYARRDKRRTFVSTAQYVDGEYIYTGASITLKSDGSSTGTTWMEKRSTGEKMKDAIKRHSILF